MLSIRAYKRIIIPLSCIASEIRKDILHTVLCAKMRMKFYCYHPYHGLQNAPPSEDDSNSISFSSLPQIKLEFIDILIKYPIPDCDGQTDGR